MLASATRRLAQPSAKWLTATSCSAFALLKPFPQHPLTTAHLTFMSVSAPMGELFKAEAYDNQGEYADLALGQRLVAARNVQEGEVVYSVTMKDFNLSTEATMHSVQLAENVHTTFPDPFALTNHSCQPNGKLSFIGSFIGEKQRWQLNAINFIALRNISVGEPITFDYNTTEWEMSSPFPCDCGQPNCVKTIRGFKHLSEANRAARQHLISPYISQKWESLENGFHFYVQWNAA